MKAIFYVVTLLCLSLLMACSEVPPTNINIESLSKKPVPPAPAEPLVLLDNANQIAGIKKVTAGTEPKDIIQVWTYEGSYTKTWEKGEDDGCYEVCAIGDADNDANDELVAVYRYETGRGKNKVTHYQIQVFESGDTDEPSRLIDITNDQILYLVVADANNDNFQEIIGGGRNHIYVLKDDGSTITQLWQSENIYSDMIFDLGVGDADNDQQNEIIYAGLFAGKFAVYDHLSGNNWGNKVYSAPISGGLDRAKVADVNNDNLNEIIGGGNYNKLTVWEHTNGEYLIDFESEDLGGFTQGVAAGDFDDDGEEEIAVGTADGNNGIVYVFKYNGSDYEIKFSDPIAGTGEISAGDSDNDGVDEFIVTTMEGLLIYDYDDEIGYSSTLIDMYIHPVMIK